MESPCQGRSLCHRGGWTGRGPSLAAEKAVGSARVMREESEQPEGGGTWAMGTWETEGSGVCQPRS